MNVLMNYELSAGLDKIQIRVQLVYGRIENCSSNNLLGDGFLLVQGPHFE